MKNNDLKILTAALTLLCAWLFVALGGQLLAAVGVVLATIITVAVIILGARERENFHDTTWARLAPIIVLFTAILCISYLHRIGVF